MTPQKFAALCASGSFIIENFNRNGEDMYKKNLTKLVLALSACFLLSSCGSKNTDTMSDSVISPAPESSVPVATTVPEKPAESVSAVTAAPAVQDTPTPVPTEALTTAPTETPAPEPSEPYTASEVWLTDDLPYAAFSVIHSEPAILYTNNQANKNGHTVCVNAGHGTSGGESVRTQCHPDGTPKVTGGSTAEGATTAMAVASGMDFADGTPERVVTLAEAIILRDLLLENGYNVLMIRETDDRQLDNIARTVLANNYADCHVAIHWDSTDYDKGAYYMSVPSDPTYRSMEPVASTWERSNHFGDCLIEGLRSVGTPIFEGGSIEMDLTQTSYSSVPSIDIELGDRVSDHSDEALATLGQGLLAGIDLFFNS